MTPAVVIRPILLNSVNQRAPSGPAAIPPDTLAVGGENSVMTPAVVIRPILLLMFSSANQRAPSGPAVIPMGSLLAVGIANSVTTCAHAPPDSKQSDASMQPRRMRSHFMFGSP